ncbi:MAG: YceD family protein [Neptuniibacter sp.]
MSDRPSLPAALRVGDLDPARGHEFSLRPDAGTLASIASELGLLGLRKLSFAGRIAAQGEKDWHLSATLGATVVQPCVVTLAPVTTRLDLPVARLFVAGMDPATEDETEMPEDDAREPLGSEIDPARVMIEALSLALPDYPRAPDADLGEAVFAAPDVAPMRDEDARPFAGLAGLRDSLAKTPDDETKG